MIKRIEKFGATWCGPCKVLEKNLETVLKNYPDIEFVSYDADENEQEFEDKHITNVPQLYFYNENGVEVHHITGAHPVNKLTDIIEYHNRTLADYNPNDGKYLK